MKNFSLFALRNLTASLLSREVLSRSSGFSFGLDKTISKVRGPCAKKGKRFKSQKSRSNRRKALRAA
jgi:hypothetical protein